MIWSKTFLILIEQKVEIENILTTVSITAHLLQKRSHFEIITEYSHPPFSFAMTDQEFPDAF